MGFLSSNDYRVFIKDATLTAVTEAGAAELGICENMAQEEIESYLRERYDMGAAFGKTGDDRYPLLVMYMIDITLYHLHSRIAGRQIPQTRIDRYNIAKDWLERAQAGKVTTGWDKKQDDDTGKDATDFRWGSLKKFSSEEY